jgi:hypothetical protein
MVDLVITIKGLDKRDCLEILKGSSMMLEKADEDTMVYPDKTCVSFKFSLPPEPVLKKV